jgi:hypothetical protein
MKTFPPKEPKSPTAVESPQRRRFGFMAGEVEIPDDFNEMGAAEIEEMFYGEPEPKAKPSP